MRTLLTGASGYIGLHVLRALLDDDQEVTALVRTPARLGPLARHPRVQVVVADLENTPAVGGHDACVHAALVWPETEGSELECRDTAAAARSFDAAGAAGVSRCIYLSSAAVHRPFTAGMSEDDRLAPADAYGATKAAGELFLRAACHTHGMSGVVLRPGLVVGPPAFDGASVRTDRRIEMMIADAREGRPIDVVRGDSRQFTSVVDLARAVRLLTRHDRPEDTYLCMDRAPITWEAVARIVLAETASRSEVRAAEPGVPMVPGRFRTERIEGLLGGPTDATAAMRAHVRALVA